MTGKCPHKRADVQGSNFATSHNDVMGSNTFDPFDPSPLNVVCPEKRSAASALVPAFDPLTS